MDACIARGGISHVLSQARASLKNPSRPYTPRTSARPLFHGDDYRPGSRPSSSYIVTEQNELQSQQHKHHPPPQQQQPSQSRTDKTNRRKEAPSAPSTAMLPPRTKAPTRKAKANGSASTRTPTRPNDDDDDDDTGASSASLATSVSHLKLVHAPVVLPDSANAVIRRTSDDRSDRSDDSDSDDHLETSLELPSQEQVQQASAATQQALDDLTSLSDCSTVSSTTIADAIDRLRTAADAFVRVSAFVLSSSNRDVTASETRAVASLRLQLFDTIAATLLERWSDSAECVVALAPSLFALGSRHCHAVEVTAAQTSHEHAVSLAKALFMLSKDAANDAAFCRVEYVEAALSVLASVSSSSSTTDGDNLTRTSRQRHSSSSSAAAASVDVIIDAAHLAFPLRMVIYVAGTLKNTSSGDATFVTLLATHGAIATLSDSLRWRASPNSTASLTAAAASDVAAAAAALAKEIAQCLVQTTAVLRNLAVAKRHHKQFLHARVAVRLCRLTHASLGHSELLANVARILSKLTLHEQPRAQINEHATLHLQSLMAVVDCSRNSALCLSPTTLSRNESQRMQDALLLRMFFVLGNLCAGNDRNRQCITFECGSKAETNSDGIDVLLHALQCYATLYATEASLPNSNSSSNDAALAEEEGENEALAPITPNTQCSDVLVKLVRLLANLAMNADVGVRLNRDCARLAPLLETLALTQRRNDDDDDELALNIVSCITNLSYYSNLESKGFIEHYRLEITALLAPILVARNEEAVVEAARAFGNVSRFPDVLEAMRTTTSRVLECLVVLLEHSNREVVYTVCGVLMNAALDASTRTQLLTVEIETTGDERSSDVRTLLVGIIECAATEDVEMACIASQALFNLLLGGGGGGSDAKTTTRRFDRLKLQRVVQRLVDAMDARDEEEKGEEKDEEEVGEERSRGWRQLRRVLLQLLKSVKATT